MIGEVASMMNSETSKAVIAIRDAIVVFLLILVTKLIEAGYPPSIEATYTAALPALLMGIISYMHALGIKKPE